MLNFRYTPVEKRQRFGAETDTSIFIFRLNFFLRKSPGESIISMMCKRLGFSERRKQCKFGRLLAKVNGGDLDIGAEMITPGRVVEYRRLVRVERSEYGGDVA